MLGVDKTVQIQANINCKRGAWECPHPGRMLRPEWTWIIASPPCGRTRDDDPVSVRPDHCPVSLIAEDFEEHGVGDAAIDDVDGIDAAARGFEGRGDLGQHAA